MCAQIVDERKVLKKAIVLFAGDSGDGMQLIGSQLTYASTDQGNDVQTFPDYPAEIRAPQGSRPGVSGFQLCFADHDVLTHGDEADVLVAMNPAALVTRLHILRRGGTIIVDQDKFQEREYVKAQLSSDPLLDPKMAQYHVVRAPITDLTLEALKESPLSRSQARRTKNMFALGMVAWLFERPLATLEQLVRAKFKEEAVIEANLTVLQAGYAFAHTTELFHQAYRVPAAQLSPGTYTQITGNEAMALAMGFAACSTGKPLLLAGYPITPASDILHEAAQMADLGVKLLQAEDEIAAAGMALGAAYGGHLAVTSTSGPGFDLTMEMVGLALAAELPMVVLDVQRAGPSTGMPTKVEQGDLLQAIFGRHGPCETIVLAPSSASHCFSVMDRALRYAVASMSPVIVLSDAYLASSAEPWKLPDFENWPAFQLQYAHDVLEDDTPYWPYQRTEKGSRLWGYPGHEKTLHRLGGLEKQASGEISYDPENHAQMVAQRRAKLDQCVAHDQGYTLHGSKQGRMLAITWGSSAAAVLSAWKEHEKEGLSVLVLERLWPLPNLKALLDGFEKVLCFEMNQGQLSLLIRADTLCDVVPCTKMQGQPWRVQEILEQIEALG